MIYGSQARQGYGELWRAFFFSGLSRHRDFTTSGE
jgi:hypothetical protein